jgi:GntR family transcriptional repressor for pyruvate dehydrogenase complex
MAAASLEQIVTQLLRLATPEPGTTARRLPPERELGEALNMSRGALREQLSVLELLGFLHRTQGRGTYIDAPGDDFVRSYFTISRQLGYLNDQQFADARVLLEESIAEAAARVITDEQVDALRADVDAMIAATKAGDHETAFEADVRFHSRLNGIVDNPIFRLMHEGFSHVLRETIRYRRLEAVRVEALDENGTRRTDSVHYDVVAALEARDPDGARAAMHEHFENWLQLHIEPVR